jgi:hypothetical protein
MVWLSSVVRKCVDGKHTIHIDELDKVAADMRTRSHDIKHFLITLDPVSEKPVVAEFGTVYDRA